jgi:predicted Zn-dependent peptidase
METYVFPNGFKMIHEKTTNHLKMSSIYCYCDVGSVFEKDGIRGVSHFVEHMCFKGTSQIPEPHDIFLTYDEIGAYFNAFTEKRLTCYTIKCEDRFVEKCTDILADMLLNSTFPKHAFKKEQKVVLEENFKNENDVRNILGEKIDAILYEGSSYQYPIDTLVYHMANTDTSYHQEKDIAYKDLVNWYKTYYIPSNFVFSIVSNLSFDKVQMIISNSMFTKQSTKKSLTHNINLSAPSILNKPRIYSGIKKGVSTDVIYIGFRTCSRFSKDRYIFKVLKHILNGMSGRLFSLLRSKNGLTYNSLCITENVEHTGHIMITTETSPTNTISNKGVLPLLIQLFIDLRTKGITEKELETAKGNIRGNYILKSELNDTIAAYNGKEYLLHPTSEPFHTLFVPYHNLFTSHIESIRRQDVNQKIKEYFTFGNMVIGIMGANPPTEKQIEDISKHLA